MTALNDDELDLVRRSFRNVSANATEAAAMFYERLFVLAPSLRPLFPAELDAQCGKLMSMLGTVVAQLHDIAALRPMLGDLAQRHVGYGAMPAHYALVGEALYWMLERRIGQGFGPAHRAAWERAYAALFGAMLDEVTAPG